MPDEKVENMERRPNGQIVPVSYVDVDYLLKEHQRYAEKQVAKLSSDIIAGFEKVGDKIAAEVKELKNTLVPAATNATKIDIKVIMPIIHVLCGTIAALIVWFTGVRPFLPSTGDGKTTAPTTTNVTVETPHQAKSETDVSTNK